MKWFEKYVGLPFKICGRDESGVDCVGLGMLILQRERGIKVWDTSIEYTVDECHTKSGAKRLESLIKDGLESSWKEVPVSDVQPFDVCLYAYHGVECHCAIVIDKAHVLHVEERHVTHVAPLRIPGYFLTAVFRAVGGDNATSTQGEDSKY